VSGPTTRNRTPSLLGATGSSICPGRPAGGYDLGVKPRPRDWIGAAILAIVLVVLVVFVVLLGAQGR